MQVKTRVTAGAIAANHNETLVRDTPRKRSRARGCPARFPSRLSVEPRRCSCYQDSSGALTPVHPLTM